MLTVVERALCLEALEASAPARPGDATADVESGARR
jgi:hypothetical protein